MNIDESVGLRALSGLVGTHQHDEFHEFIVHHGHVVRGTRSGAAGPLPVDVMFEVTISAHTLHGLLQ